MNSPDKKEGTFFKEHFGFVEGLEVEAYLVDPASNQAEFIGNLRPDYAHGADYAHDLPRLYERFDLQVAVPGPRRLYFGQKDKAPHIIALEPDPDNEGDFKGEMETERFKAQAELSVYSPYVDERYILTVEVLLKDFTKSGDALPEAWRNAGDSKAGSDDTLPTV